MEITEFGPQLLLNPRSADLLPVLNICYVLFLITACGFACISCIAVYFKFRNSRGPNRTRVIAQRILQPPAYSLQRTEQFPSVNQLYSNSNPMVTTSTNSAMTQAAAQQQSNLRFIAPNTAKYICLYRQTAANIPPPSYSDVFPS
uniref:Uncharacterized protein n=1 Tax=Syphacia muris TaxID=451379 RepID=A0A0N5B0S2_9BILA